MNMGQKLKKIPYTLAALGLIGAAAIASLFQEIGVAMSGVIIQLGLCKTGNSGCLLAWLSFLAIGIILFALLLDYGFSRKGSPQNTFEEENIDQNIPVFYTRIHHAEIIVKDSNAGEVAKFIYQYLNDIPWFSEGANCFIKTSGGEYYNPEKDAISHHGFIAHGEKSIAQHGYYMVGEAKGTIDPIRINLPEMFFIKVVQGGQNTSLVIFDTDDKDVFLSYPKGLLKQLREVFHVTTTKGLPEESIKKNVETWKSVTIEEYEFPSSSLFGLGLKVKNKRKSKIEISAELKYVVNTNTKDVPIITLNGLPWATGNSSCKYEPQTIEKGKEKDLVVLCWNKAEREIWFPTSSPENAPQNYNIIIDDGTTKALLRIGNDRTQVIGQNFYFEIQFNAKINGKNVNFTWKGYLIYDDRGMRYDQNR